eukprot:342182_1
MNKGTRNTTMMILAGNTINDKKEIVRDSITINNNETVKEAFKNAMTKALSRQPNTPAKICLFLECDQFYEFKQDIHQHFVGELAINDKYEIITWDAKQNRKIQDLAKNYAIQNKIGMQVWRDVFDQLIQTPLERSIDVGSIALLLFPNKQEEEEEKKNEEFNSNEINPFFINKLHYCILMKQWVGFAAQSKQIIACKALLDFVQNQLKQLNKYMFSHASITIKCLEFLSNYQDTINELANDSQYKKFDTDKLKVLVDQFGRWSDIKLHFIRFLAYTRKDEDYVIEETLDFTDFIKNWQFESFKKVNARSEWKNLLYKSEDKLKDLYDNFSSGVFISIWLDHRCENGISMRKWDFNAHFKKLHPKVMKTWKELVNRASASKLTFSDTMWFKEMDIETELSRMKLPKETIAEIQKDIKDSLHFKAYTDFVENLIKLTEMLAMLVSNEITKVNLDNKDETWKRLKKTWKNATEEKCEQSQNISIPARLNRNMRKYVGVDFDDLHLQWVNKAVFCATTLSKMATDDHFQSESWESTLDLLQDNPDGEIRQLSASLRSVHRVLSTICSRKYNSRTEIMRNLSKIDLTMNDTTNLLQVHNELPKIDVLVAEVSKTAAARDYAKLHNAISNGQFKFDAYGKIKEYIDKYDDISDVIKQSVHLNEYVDSEIQAMMDIILLCKSNKKQIEDMKSNDDEKCGEIVFNVTDGGLEDEKESFEINVNDIIRKYDICKEISELRIRFIMNGGRISENTQEIIKASSSIKEFNDKRQEWLYKLNEWNEYIMSIRNGDDSIHLSNYFTINDVRMIIQKLNKYKDSNGNNNKLIFQEIFAHFSFVNHALEEISFKKIIDSWDKMNPNLDKSLIQFYKFFNVDVIVNRYNVTIKDCSQLINGRPNLWITKKKSEAMFGLLQLFANNKYSKNHLILSYQILICTKTTTPEEMCIFILRCLQNTIRFEYDATEPSPLYAILFPEDLSYNSLDQTVLLFNEYLLCTKQITFNYSLLVISCDENNMLSHILSSYRTKLSIQLSSEFGDTLFSGKQ